VSDYPAAIDYPAHPTNTLGPPCNPKGWVLHTPEEPADDHPGTPIYFAQPNRRASTHYFVSYLGFIYQMVPESVAPIANGVWGRPYPAWADPNVSLNRQTLSVEIEGYATSIARTLSPAQKKALLDLLRYGCRKYAIPLKRSHIIGHYQVASNRTDPGTLNIDSLVAELQAAETVDERRVIALIHERIRHTNQQFRDEVFHLIREFHKDRDLQVARLVRALQAHEARPHPQA
jgi:N-acetyl-anhydromuramyl-L-alanine amidase AmpD